LHRRFCHLWLSGLALASAILVSLFSSPAAAASKDGQAEKLYSQAMDEDYLNTKFDDAIDKLEKALKACGKNGCSDEVVAKLNVGLGVIHGGGKNNNALAKKYFIAAFEADSGAEPLEFYMTDKLKELFQEAQQEAGGDDDDDDGGGDDDDDSGDDDDDDVGGDLTWNAPDEALVNYPLPIFIDVPDALDAASVKVKFKPFGGSSWQSLKTRKMKGGFGGVIPCSEITTTGDLKLYVLIKDKEGDSIATAGTRKRPLVIDIKNDIDGKQPSLPGEKPPEKCMTAADCPPDFPGCKPSSAGGGGKGWGASCEDNDECREGLTCLNGFCEQGEGDDDDDDDDDDDGEIAKNIFYLGAQFDLQTIQSADNVCGSAAGASSGYTQELTNYFCYYNDGTGEYLGKPSQGDFNQVQGGLGFAGVRILAGYDRILWKGLAVGGRFGFIIGGQPGKGDADSRYQDCVDAAEAAGGDANDCHQSKATSFIPAHVELRVSYFFPDPAGFADGLIRPYGFAGFGIIGPSSASVPVAVCDYVDKDDGFSPVGGTGDGRCPAGTTKRDNIEAYQITGLNFVDFGLGSTFALHPMFGINVEAKIQMMLPDFGVVIAPSVSPVFMF